jgi:hypothetical protein
MQWLDRFPIAVLALITVPLMLAPFYPEPHLIEKLRMLFSGRLTSPTDMLDLVLHGTPALLLVLRVLRSLRQRSKTAVPH